MHKLVKVQYLFIVGLLLGTFYLLPNIASAAVDAGPAEEATNQVVSTDYDRDKQCKEDNIKPDDNCLILKYIVIGINLLSALVGIAVVMMIALGGIQYTTARDSPQAAAAAKDKIRTAIFALVAYLFMWTLLQYLIPGGVL